LYYYGCSPFDRAKELSMLKITVNVPCEIQAEPLAEAKRLGRDLRDSGSSLSDGVNSFEIRTDRVRWKDVRDLIPAVSSS
jgi:hypothetical protein